MYYLDSLLKLIEQECDNPALGVEVGVHRGKMSARLLRGFPSLTLVMVDLWGEWNDPNILTRHSLEDQKQYREHAMISTEFAASRRRIIEEDSADAANLFHDKQKPDFVFIDADHSYEACLQDMEAWWPVTKTLFCGHDYGKPEFGVTQAVTEFCKKHDIIVNVAEGHIWWTNKLS